MARFKIALILVLILSIYGCASVPGIKATSTDDGKGIQIQPLENKGWLAWLFPAKLPAGSYEAELNADGSKKLKMDSKADLKLIDLNMSKIEG